MDFSNFITTEAEHTQSNKNHIIQEIFKDWWDAFLEQNTKLNIRDVVKKEVSKFMNCGSKDNGFAI